jgi:phage terminase large subunit-like protein
MGFGPFLTTRLGETKTYIYRKQFPSASDKATRAQAIRGRMAMGKVYFPKTAEWVSGLISEIMVFPAGKNDDQVDCLSLIGRLLDVMVRGQAQKSPYPLRGANEMTWDELIKYNDRHRGRLVGGRI